MQYIDELGYPPINKLGADGLFQILSYRYERGAALITTNRVYSQWASTFNCEFSPAGREPGPDRQRHLAVAAAGEGLPVPTGLDLQGQQARAAGGGVRPAGSDADLRPRHPDGERP